VSAASVHTDSVALANRLRPALVQLARGLRQEVHPLGVTGGQVTLLNAIRNARGIGVRGLAAQERISPPAVTAHVKRLERAGLVRRERSGRRVGLFLTDEGERVLRLVRTRRTAWLAERLKRLSPAELAAVEAAVEPLSALAGDRG
jgi:DNA-binding MarR family transcriptional regulator